MNKQQKLIGAICVRASDIYKSRELKINPNDIRMDIDCVMETVELDLQKLLDTDDYNLMHDIRGICRHLNRKTRKLENCFLPRCAK